MGADGRRCNSRDVAEVEDRTRSKPFLGMLSKLVGLRRSEREWRRGEEESTRRNDREERRGGEGG